jgi:hypothetical protein
MVLIMFKEYKLFIVALSGILLLSKQSYGQQGLLKYAEKQVELENYASAATIYNEAYLKNKQYSTAVKLAETYGKLGDYVKSYEWWSRAVGFAESGRSDFLGYLKSAVRAGKWEDLGLLLTWGGYTESDFPEFDFSGIRRLYGQKANVKLVPVKGVNSPNSEYGISSHPDGKLYFASNRGGSNRPERSGLRLDSKNNIFSTEIDSYTGRDFYRLYSYSNDGELSVLVTDLSDVLHMNDPSLMAGGDLIFYTALVAKTKIKGKKEVTNYPGIYYGSLGSDGKITGSTAFPYNDHVSYGVMNPFVDTEMNRVYFASDMPGGYGGYDIYYVEYDGEMNFGKPVNLGPEVNTPENESHPSRSGSRFYFSSRGHIGLGGMDVFTGDHMNGEITGVMNMGIPYNSFGDDFAYVVSSDGKRYLSSDRAGGMGLDDIYVIEELSKIFQARVVDCNNNLIMEDYEVELGKRYGSGKQYKQSADFSAELDLDSDFSLRIYKRGFFSVNDDSLTTKGFVGDTLYREYKLVAIPYRTLVNIDTILNEIHISEKNKDGDPELDLIAKLMDRFGFIGLVVNSYAHMDSRFSDEQNKLLTEYRAESIRIYLSRYGISGRRVRINWHGQGIMEVDCGNGIPCPEDYNKLNSQSELELEVFPDTDMQYYLPSEFTFTDICQREFLISAMQKEIIETLKSN